MATLSVSHGEQAVVIHWRTTYDATSPYLLKDSEGNALQQGTSVNQDGALVVLGYFTESSASNLFQGEFVPLTSGTTIGDSSYGSGFGPGILSFTTKFVVGTQTVSVYPDEPASYDVNASHVIGTSSPATNTLLAIRFYDQSIATNSAKYNTVASPDWKWPGASSNIPENKYFIIFGDSGTGNTSTTHYVFGNTFENSTSPYQAAIPFYFDLILKSQGEGTVGPADANGTYVYGANQQITATVTNSHYEFSGWSGSGIADANASITTVSMTEDRNITAVFEPKDYSLTVLVDDSSRGTATGGGSFSYGTVPTITATAAEGYRFTSWSGTGVVDSNASTTTVNLDQDLTVTANFELKQYDLEVNVATGGTVATSSGPYYHFGVYDLNATPAVGYDFTQWTGADDDIADVNDSTTTIKMDSDANVTAVFTEKSYLVTVSSTSGGDANGSGIFLHSQILSITASPQVGYKFTGWSGDIGSLGDANASSTTLSMSIAAANLSITANFALKEYPLAVNANQGGDANGTESYKHFDQVEVVASPLSGWSFSHWSGDTPALSSDQNASTTVNVTGNTSITANFTRNQYVLTVLSGTGGDANGSGIYQFESNAALTASPNPPEGYAFSHWSGDISTVADVNASTTTIQLPASDITVTANFSTLSYAVSLTVEGDVNGTVGFQGDANGSLSKNVTYNYDENVSILAFANGPDAGSPARGYYFDHWTWITSTESGTTSDNPYSFNLIRDFNATASFFPIPPNAYRVTLSKNISAGGSLYVANGGFYDEDTSFPLIASVADGYTFLSWTSSGINSFSPGDFNSTATVTLDENSTATASFLQNQYFLDVSTTSDGNATGGGSSYVYGESADANATPDSIHDFDRWEIDKTIDYSVGVGNKAHDGNASVYLIKGQERPSLVFIRGFSYSFEVNGSEPFHFSTNQNGGGDYTGEFTAGVTNSRASGGTTITIVVDENTPDLLHYYSGTTSGMGSAIQVLTKTDAEIVPFPTQASTSITLKYDLSLLATYKLKTYDLTLSGETGGTAEANASGPYEHGSIVTITAIPSAGYDFLNWSGDTVGDSSSISTSISMTEARSVTANFKIKSYSLTLTSNSSGGSVRTSDNENIYEYGTNVTLLATPSQGYSFVEWVGDFTSPDQNATFSIDGNKSINGTFQGNVHNLSLSQITRNADNSLNANNNLGGSLSAGSSFSHGTVASLLATANPGYEFVEWETNGTIELEVTVSNGAFALKSQNRPTLILVRGNVYNFNLDGISTSIHPFYLSTSNDGGGTMTGLYTTGVTNSSATSGTVSFSPDDSTPDTLYYYSGSFAGMGNQIHVIDSASIDLGQFSATNANASVTMVADRSYRAVFKRKSYVVSYAAYPENAGSISFDSYDGTSAVEHGTSITSTATAANGYVFVSWSGEGLSPVQQVQPTLNLSVTSAQAITANFAKDGEVTLTLSVSPEGTGSVAGAGIYTYSPALPIYATATDGYAFVGWQGGDSYLEDLNASATRVNLIENLDLTAIFELVPSSVNEPKARPMDSIYYGWDWWQSDWFDNYWYISGKNWIFHESLGWSYMVVQSEESVWIWIEFLNGWIWTNRTLYPFIYDYPNSEWIWFNREQSDRGEGNRIFYRYSTSEWETR